MGLFDAFYEFNGELPSLNQIEQKIRELSSERLMMEGTIEPGLNDVHRAQAKRPAGVGLPMRDSRARFWIEGDRPRWKRWVALTVSLDGTKVVLHSNYGPLLRSACDAMAALSGHIYSPGKVKLDKNRA